MNHQAQMSFLALPKAVRIQIYILSGLTRPCPIDLVSESHRRQNGYIVNDACVAFQKMKTCTYLKWLRDSGTPLPTAERAHFICYGPVLPLSLFQVCKSVYLEASQLFYSANKFQLRVLRKSDLSYLRNLSPHALSSLRSLHVDLGGREYNSLPLDSLRDSKRSEEFLEQWTSTIRAVAQSVAPSHLYFAFTCRSADLDVGTQLLASLEPLPPLRGCALSLGSHQDEGFRPLVQATAAHLLGHSPASGAQFRFEKLPKELRLKIFEQTNLVPKQHASSAYGVIRVWGYGGRLRVLRKCCSRCNDCLESCCCYWHPAAFSQTCICAAPPTALFTVNRQMYHEAQEVLFSRNLFILSYPLSCVSFLEVLNETQLARIRRIEIHFWDTELQGWSEDGEIQMSWHRLVSIMRMKLDLCRLELRINLANCNDPVDREYVVIRTEEVLAPLKQLTGLRKLFIYLGYFSELEAKAEKEVMGPGYDSEVEGKPPEFYDFS